MASHWESVAAGQTAQVLGGSGKAGDWLESIAISASTGTITVIDGSATVLVIPAAATGVWRLNARSKNGPWKITTASSTSCTCFGDFT